MPEITIVAMNGAEIKVDGVTIGDTPVEPPTPQSLEAFRLECLSNGRVSCSWSVLRTRLEDQTVSKLWWDLTRDERYNIGKEAVDGTKLNRDLRFTCPGLPNCAGAGGDWKNAACVHDGIIRYLQLVSKDVVGADSCYYKYLETSEAKCWFPKVSYNLPGALVACATPYGPGYGHTMCALQIDKDISKLDNWVIFQYSEYDIKPGTWQIPTHTWDDLYLTMRTFKTVLVGCNGTDDSTDLIKFYL